MPQIGVRVSKKEATTAEGALKFGYEVTKGKDGKLYYRKSKEQPKKKAPPKPSVPPFKEEVKVVKAPPMGASFVVVEKDGKRMLVKAKPMKTMKVALRQAKQPMAGVVVAGQKAKKAVKKVEESEKKIEKQLKEHKKEIEKVKKALKQTPKSKKAPAKKAPAKRAPAKRAPAKRVPAVRKPLTEEQKERRRFMARRRYHEKTMPKKVAKCKKIGMVMDPANPFF